MKTISKVVSRSALTLAVAGLGLIFTPRIASADFVTFDVNEGAVSGANSITLLDAWELTGHYTETLTVTGGTFTATATANFNNYNNNLGQTCGSPGNCGPDGSQISNAVAPNFYDIIATMTAQGTVETLNGTTCFAAVCFFGTSGTASLYLDPDQNGTPDNLLLSSNTLVTPGSGGQTDLQTLPSTGNFNLIFGNLLLTSLGSSYFPSFTNLLLSATVNGDFDSITTVQGTQNLTGQLSAQFTTVPEPATLTLLGLGLTGLAAARRRKGQGTPTV